MAICHISMAICHMWGVANGLDNAALVYQISIGDSILNKHWNVLKDQAIINFFTAI